MADGLDEEGFVSATRLAPAIPAARGAAAYSFFGDGAGGLASGLGGLEDDSILDGELEAGLEAPPEDEGVIDVGLQGPSGDGLAETPGTDSLGGPPDLSRLGLIDAGYPPSPPPLSGGYPAPPPALSGGYPGPPGPPSLGALGGAAPGRSAFGAVPPAPPASALPAPGFVGGAGLGGLLAGDSAFSQGAFVPPPPLPSTRFLSRAAVTGAVGAGAADPFGDGGLGASAARRAQTLRELEASLGVGAPDEPPQAAPFAHLAPPPPGFDSKPAPPARSPWGRGAVGPAPHQRDLAPGLSPAPRAGAAVDLRSAQPGALGPLAPGGAGISPALPPHLRARNGPPPARPRAAAGAGRGGPGAGGAHPAAPAPLAGPQAPLQLHGVPPTRGSREHAREHARGARSENGGAGERPTHPATPVSSWMTAGDLDYIVTLQARGLGSGDPYRDDYYFQAFLSRHVPLAKGGAAPPKAGAELAEGRGSPAHAARPPFAPAAVRALDPTERAGLDAIVFAEGSGLGKLAFANLKRPRPLLDLLDAVSKGKAEGDAPHEGGGGKGGGKGAEDTPPAEAGGAPGSAPQKRLWAEPALAARLLVEDCESLMLDVDDADRLLAAAFGVAARRAGRGRGAPTPGAADPDALGPDSSADGAPRRAVAALCKRRADLVEGLADSLRLSLRPEGGVAAATAAASPDPARPPPSDSVLLRLARGRKGARMLARACAAATPPRPPRDAGPPPPADARVLWAVLRRARQALGEPAARAAAAPGAPDRAFARAVLAAGASRALAKLPGLADASRAADALLAGDLLDDERLPLGGAAAASGDERPPSLADVLVTLLRRGRELRGARSSSAADTAAWARREGALVTAIDGHLEVGGELPPALADELALVAGAPQASLA